MHKIRLMAADSRCATEQELAEAGITSSHYPMGWRLMAHQAQTIRALRYGEAPVIINNAMTGDGKSLAGQLQVFNDRTWRTLAMYPTNELAIDQRRGLDARLSAGQPPAWNPHGLQADVINAERLDALQEAFERLDVDIKRPEALNKFLENDYILTNPDIFHLTVSFAYRQFGRARDISLGTLARRYRLFVFDEFHLYGTPQTGSVMVALLLLRQMRTDAYPPRFLFLSATPQDHMKEMARSIGLGVESIEGDYRHGLDETPENHRRILRAADVTLYSGGLEEWCQKHLDDVILRFFREQRPHGAKGVIIANSIATAHRTHALLRQACDPDIRIGLNTGLVPRAERIMDCDLLVGTSTIDVGVDFRINLLIFECFDDASHIQRLGRLGRHETDSQGRPFAAFEAHALVPPWVVEGMAEVLPSDTPVSRVDYHKNLRNWFTPQETFTQYTTRWAGVQAGQVLHQMHSPEIKAQYADIVPILKAQFKGLFGGSVNKYFALLKDENSHPVIRSASSFRGDSPFTAIVRDTTTEHGKSNWINYNLISLLRNTNLKYVDNKDMIREYQSLRQHTPSLIALERGDPLGAFHILGWIDGKPREITITTADAVEARQHESVEVMTGFRFEVMGNIHGLRQINDALEIRPLVCFLIPNQKPDDVRRKCRLGLQVQLLQLRIFGDSMLGTAAFGRDALMLDSVWRRRRDNSDAPLIF